MTVTTLAGWVADGQKFRQCQPLLDLRATLGRHGYTGPATGYPDLRHLQAHPPEDHCPFSNTPWPGAQPYPYCMALDIMPTAAFDWAALMGKIVADKLAGVPGTEPIKYINWTDTNGQCWHDSWMPEHTRSKSTDTGHGHISIRTDYVHSGLMAGYDPLGGKRNDMANFFYTADGSQYIADPAFERYWAFNLTATFNAVHAAAGNPPPVLVNRADVDAGLFGEYMGNYAAPRKAPASGGGTPTTLTVLTVPTPPA